MSAEFDVARDAFALSAPGRAIRSASHAFASAWQTSSIRFALQHVSGQLRMPAAERVRAAAIAVAVAAALQPLLIWLMSPTVRPTVLPMLMIALALLAAAVAWLADAIVAAWPSSRPARMWRR